MMVTTQIGVPPENSYFLQTIIPDRGYTVGVELGVRRGEFTTTLCSLFPSLTMYAVDAWAQVEGMDETHPHEANYQKAMNHFAPYQSRIKVLRMSFNEAAEQVPDKSVDFIFIDGTHTEVALRNDVRRWAPKIRPGGLLSGHDHHPAFDHGRMQRFINRLSGSLIVDQFSCWWFPVGTLKLEVVGG